MKYLPHIALPLLMVGLLVLATVLPKFVNQSAGEDDTTLSRPEFGRLTEKLEVLPDYRIKPEESDSQILAPVASGPRVNYDALLQPFLAKLEMGDLDGAEEVLTGYGKSLPSGMKAGLRYSLESARKSEEALAIAKAETAKAVHAAKEAELLAKVNAEKELALATIKAETEKTIAEASVASIDPTSGGPNLSKFQAESAEKIRMSLMELNKATQAAKLAAQQAERSALETAKLRAAFEATRPISPIKRTETTAVVKPSLLVPAMNLPEGTKIQFTLNSSQIPSSAESSISQIADMLLKEPRLGIQLRGYADSVGNPEYNAILSRARSQNVEDSLVKKGVNKSQIDLLPFGSSHSPKGQSKSHRRVDLVFFEI